MGELIHCIELLLLNYLVLQSLIFILTSQVIPRTNTLIKTIY